MTVIKSHTRPPDLEPNGRTRLSLLADSTLDGGFGQYWFYVDGDSPEYVPELVERGNNRMRSLWISPKEHRIQVRSALRWHKLRDRIYDRLESSPIKFNSAGLVQVTFSARLHGGVPSLVEVSRQHFEY